MTEHIRSRLYSLWCVTILFYWITTQLIIYSTKEINVIDRFVNWMKRALPKLRIRPYKEIERFSDVNCFVSTRLLFVVCLNAIFKRCRLSVTVSRGLLVNENWKWELPPFNVSVFVVVCTIYYKLHIKLRPRA